jgi:hypothetical protein
MEEGSSVKFIAKCLIAVLAIVLALAVYDTVFNGLLKGDGYRPVTEQMREISKD